MMHYSALRGLELQTDVVTAWAKVLLAAREHLT